MNKIVAVVAMLGLAALAASAQSLMKMRMTPEEIKKEAPADQNQIGSSNVPGVHTKIIFGDPSQAEFYSILLYVPAHTTIQAHAHRDNRMATVVSGEWRFGYGDRFDSKALKTLPPGSVYSEPGKVDHFAQTTDTPVVVEISGYGPTDTVYFEPKNDPQKQKD